MSELKDDWILRDDETTEEAVLKNGNRMLIGNGYMGYRGTVEEASPDEMPAVIINGVYDRNGDKWREPVNMPNPLFIQLSHEGENLASTSRNVMHHEQQIDFRHGIFSRSTEWKCGETVISFQSERFASMDDEHLFCMRCTLFSDRKLNVKLSISINPEVYDINGPHFSVHSCETQKMPFGTGHISRMYGETKELHESFVVAQYVHMFVGSCITEDSDARLPVYALSLEPGTKVSFSVYASIFTELDYDTARPPAIQKIAEDASKTVSAAAEHGYEALKKIHGDCWEKIWQTGDIRIEGDDEAQKALRFSLYHLNSIAPRGNKDLSVPARGLSGQTYKGAIFWDTEIFISPYFLYTDPAVAKNFIRYRIKTLPGARRKAAEYGFRGAFYAWESQENGDDACSDYNVTDVFTKRPVRTYFRDRQVHISAAIVYAIVQYIEVTGDYSVLFEGALEVIIECARFYVSRCVYIPYLDRYELQDVIGPDEYHERVYNNAYTNRMALFTVQTALFWIKNIRMEKGSMLEDILSSLKVDDEVPLFEQVARKLYVPEPQNVTVAGEQKTGIIPQFDGYFTLEDCSIETVRSRLINPQEYWGGSTGVASDTQVIKQADVAVLLNLFGSDYSDAEKAANYAYYEPRTEHGSSLSACMYALLACRTGQIDKAYRFFKQTAEVDITGKSKQFAGLVYIGGTHPAANGGAWMTVIQGFCGMTCKNGTLSLKPALPEHWKRVSFSVMVRGEWYSVTVTHEGYNICKQ